MNAGAGSGKGAGTAMVISQIRKRNGDMVSFDASKIRAAIIKAQEAVSQSDPAVADKITEHVIEHLKRQGFDEKSHPTVEDIQDVVEHMLIKEASHEVLKAYIVYRYERRQVRDEKKRLLNQRHLDPVSKSMDIAPLRVLASRYLNKNKMNQIVETPEEMYTRIAVLIGISDMMHSPLVYDKNGDGLKDTSEAESYLEKLDSFDGKLSIGKYYLNKWHFRSMIHLYCRFARSGNAKVGFRDLLEMLASKKMVQYEDKITSYMDIMISGLFLPNTPTIMNAGGELGQLSACFVLEMKDHMKDIMKTASNTAIIFKSGGGVGINYSDLREEGSMVASTSGVASGPVSFMNIIDTVTEVIKQGGRRRGANMGIVEVWHPDIEKFIENKTKPGVLENFNISVGVWEDFWKAVENDEKYALRSPVGNEVEKQVSATDLVERIAHSAWTSAEPGLIFFDNINKHNVFEKARGMPIRCTNPCGEQGLYPYESCNLGSINLSALTTRNADGSYEFDWLRYEEAIRLSTRFLDAVIDVNTYPMEQIEKASVESRRIGLGVMGVADLLYMLRIPYNSEEGYELQSKLAEALSYYSMDESAVLARERGPFEMCSKSGYADGELPLSGYYEGANNRTYEWDGLIDKIKKYGIRNVLTTTVAPTGTLSMIAGCSSGIEPVFGLTF